MRFKVPAKMTLGCPEYGFSSSSSPHVLDVLASSIPREGVPTVLNRVVNTDQCLTYASQLAQYLR